jgi:hypothetical protein
MSPGKCYKDDEEDKELTTDEIEALYVDEMIRQADYDEMISSYYL